MLRHDREVFLDRMRRVAVPVMVPGAGPTPGTGGSCHRAVGWCLDVGRRWWAVAIQGGRPPVRRAGVRVLVLVHDKLGREDGVWIETGPGESLRVARRVRKGRVSMSSGLRVRSSRPHGLRLPWLIVSVVRGGRWVLWAPLGSGSTMFVRSRRVHVGMRLVASRHTRGVVMMRRAHDGSTVSRVSIALGTEGRPVYLSQDPCWGSFELKVEWDMVFMRRSPMNIGDDSTRSLSCQREDRGTEGLLIHSWRIEHSCIFDS
ncbi:hypothetical protein BJ875DRAFT_200463 [Amylocarpus encephaloides]|uniref:Uncharacterized protein n=1 Tax=Amylocarpus encephaloides TaxID=45428 RepID=A0A9P7YA83_9HELO|nr:hypothetical protein BJ875DRAFT_200463 [Amylocarpus encephaloides]